MEDYCNSFVLYSCFSPVIYLLTRFKPDLILRNTHSVKCWLKEDVTLIVRTMYEFVKRLFEITLIFEKTLQSRNGGDNYKKLVCLIKRLKTDFKNRFIRGKGIMEG